MTESRLGRLFDASGSDKGRLGYGPLYERHLPPRGESVRLLELGIDEGGSVRAWLDWFTHPRTQIVGLDHSPRRAGATPPRATYTQGDQADPHAIAVVGGFGPYDVIVDDCSHLMEPTQASFSLLWPYLRPGGIYVVEDLETSYSVAYGGGLGVEGTVVEMLKELVDETVGLAGTGPAALHFYRNIAFLEARLA